MTCLRKRLERQRLLSAGQHKFKLNDVWHHWSFGIGAPVCFLSSVHRSLKNNCLHLNLLSLSSPCSTTDRVFYPQYYSQSAIKKRIKRFSEFLRYPNPNCNSILFSQILNRFNLYRVLFLAFCAFVSKQFFQNF